MTFDEYFNARWPEFQHPKTSAREIWDAAQAAEREECAKECELIASHPSSLWEEDGCWAHSAENCATAIRARSEK